MELPEEDKKAQEAWDKRAQEAGEAPPAERLYKLYSGWSGQLHTWCREKLGRHVDAEFFPIDWKFRVYSGRAQGEVSLFGVPHLMRPEGEKSFTIRLPTPDEDPSPQRLDECFKNICLATARVLEIDLGVPKLGGQKKGTRGHKTPVLPAPDSPDEPKRPRALRDKPKRLPPGTVDRPGPETKGKSTPKKG